MKYCKKCGAEIFDDAVMCPSCKAMQKEIISKKPVSTENKIWGTLAILFGILGSGGLVFGIIGLIQYNPNGNGNVNDSNHKSNMTKSYIGLGLGIFWIILSFISILVSAMSM